MSTALATQSHAGLMERVVVLGDLGALSEQDRITYYAKVCESVGLNPLTRPFDYIRLNGKLTLYAKRDATDQLRKIHGVSITKLEREAISGVYTVTAYASDKSGRTDSSIGAVTVEGLKGDNMANAMMKAETKSKRRVTLSLCGLGILDESEIETIPASSRQTVVSQPVEDVEPQIHPDEPSVDVTDPLANVDEFDRMLRQQFRNSGFNCEQTEAAIKFVLKAKKKTTTAEFDVAAREAFITGIAEGKFDKFKKVPAKVTEQAGA